MTKKAPTTAATQALDRLGLPYTPHPYEHDRVRRGLRAGGGARARRRPRAGVQDARGGGGRPLAVAVVPVSAMLDLKSLAAVLGAKSATMAAPDLAERRTGYVVGGISPFGQRTRLPLVLDATAQDFATVLRLRRTAGVRHRADGRRPALRHGRHARRDRGAESEAAPALGIVAVAGLPVTSCGSPGTAPRGRCC